MIKNKSYYKLLETKKNFDNKLTKYINRYSKALNVKTINENNYKSILSNYCLSFSDIISDKTLKSTFLNYSFNVIDKIEKNKILDVNKKIEEAVSMISNNMGYVISCYDKNNYTLISNNKNYYLNMFNLDRNK